MSETVVTGKRHHPVLQRRSLDVNFTLKTGGFGPNGEDSLTLSGHRVRAHIANAGMAAGSSLSLRISGMTLSKMNRLSVIRARQTWQSANTITLYGSGNDGAKVAIFSGYITAAFVDFTGAPDVVFQVEANNLSYAAAKAMPVISFGSAVDFGTIASLICVSQGWALKNHGVKATFPNYYGYGDARSALEKLCLSVKAIFHFDFINANTQVLHIWPRDYSYAEGDVGADTPYVSKSSGLIGYPAYSDAGVMFQCLFNPYIRYYTPVRLQSDYAPAGWVDNKNGQLPQGASPASSTWLPYVIEHTLESEIPDGQWQTFVGAVRGDNPLQFKF